MNNQQWQPAPEQQPFGQPQWNQPQPPNQPYPGASAPFNSPSQSFTQPGASAPFSYPSSPPPPPAPWGQQPYAPGEWQPSAYETSTQPGSMFMPTAMGKLNAPRKQNFLTKRVSVPMWLIIVAVIVMLGLLGGIIDSSGSRAAQQTATTSSSNSSPRNNNSSQSAAPTQAATQAPTPTPAPTHALKWTTVQTFTGNGIKQTQTFTVGDDWKILWSCNPSSFYGYEYNVQVYVYDSDGSALDVAVNTICKAGNTSDSTEEHQGGSIYLSINSEGSWKIQVQELK